MAPGQRCADKTPLGDIALIALCGAFLGLKLTLFVLFASPIVATLDAIPWMIWQSVSARAESASGDEAHLTTMQMLQAGEIPFGVFLGTCALLAVFWGERAWSLYLGWAKLR